MNISIRELEKQWRRVLEHGWLVFFKEAASQYKERTEVLLAIASRESDMGGRELRPGVFDWLTRPGDNGNGFGLMQADIRSYPDWIRSGEWKDARKSILMGARILAEKRDGIIKRAGQTCRVKDSKTKQWYSFVMPAVPVREIEQAAIAAYNGGDWPLYHSTKGRPYDHGTTGRDYSEDVLGRAREFRRLINSLKESSKATTEPRVETEIAPGAGAESAVAPDLEPSKPAAEEAAKEAYPSGEQVIQEAASIPTIKECGKGFARVLFGGWKKISGWIAGISIGADSITPVIVVTVIAAIAIGFIYYTVKKRKKARAK